MEVFDLWRMSVSEVPEGKHNFLEKKNKTFRASLDIRYKDKNKDKSECGTTG